MPNIKSAKKRVLIARTRALRNQMVKSAIKTAIRRFEAATAANDSAEAKRLFSYAVKRIDQAVAKGVLKKNTAARKKSQLARKFNATVA
jgi:small subunit ribosomal protein S20